MKMNSWVRRGLVAVPALAVAALMGCGDLLGTERRPADPLADLGPGIHPVLVVAKQGGGEATLELHLKRVEVASKVASYQGELTYDPQALTLKGAQIPQGITGVWNEAQKGNVRFAGVSMEGIAEGAVLSIQFDTQHPVQASAFKLKIEELVAAEGFENLTSRVRQSDMPLFSLDP